MNFIPELSAPMTLDTILRLCSAGCGLPELASELLTAEGTFFQMASEVPTLRGKELLKSPNGSCSWEGCRWVMLTPWKWNCFSHDWSISTWGDQKAETGNILQGGTSELVCILQKDKIYLLCVSPYVCTCFLVNTARVITKNKQNARVDQQKIKWVWIPEEKVWVE